MKSSTSVKQFSNIEQNLYKSLHKAIVKLLVNLLCLHDAVK